MTSQSIYERAMLPRPMSDEGTLKSINSRQERTGPEETIYIKFNLGRANNACHREVWRPQSWVVQGLRPRSRQVKNDPHHDTISPQI